MGGGWPCVHDRRQSRRRRHSELTAARLNGSVEGAELSHVCLTAPPCRDQSRGQGKGRPTARAGREGPKPAPVPEPGPGAGPSPPTEEEGGAFIKFHVSPTRVMRGLFYVWVSFLNQYHVHRTGCLNKTVKSQREGGWGRKGRKPKECQRERRKGMTAATTNI